VSDKVLLVDLGFDPAAAPAAVAETHISVVVFAGSRAYKLCKAVSLGFLDYSTREQRRAALERELVVNRRFAPDVYLGLLDLVDGDGEVHDHVLVMRRMPAERRLSRLLDGPDAAELLRDVAKEVASVHAASPRPAAAAEAASRRAVGRNWRDNEAAMEPHVGPLLESATFERVGEGYRRYLAGRAPLFETRIRDGHAVDGHGDLLAEDIFCLDDGPRILDCLAFDDQLRYGDVLADVAFLAMDVERLAGPAAAGELLRWYGEFSAEHHPASLAHHYIAYRAQVRAKVACLRASQGDEPARAAAREHLRLCVAHLDQGRVRLVLVGGAPGTGKSTLAAAVAEATGWALLRSDEIRKELAGLGPLDDTTAPLGTGLYRPAAVAATYEELRRRARLLLERGESVILDASWSDVDQRLGARRLAEAVVADLVELRVDAPAPVAAARIAARRAAGGDPSDVTVEVAAALGARFDPWPEATIIETTGPPPDSLRRALAVSGAVP
jgi:aminoglycoside phosphotransferase family enzyme/predicted kinase